MKTISSQAKAAKAIRTELKEAYPTIKFTVKSRGFSMGDAVDVSWNLGPTDEQTQKVIDKYQYGHFDGMTDYYEHSNSRDDIPQSKYVHANRHYRTKEEITQYKINEKVSWKDSLYVDMYKEERTLYHIIGRDLCKLIGIAYLSLEQKMPQEYVFQVTGFLSPCLNDLVRRISYNQPLMTGYHGVRFQKNDEGKDITNAFEIY